VDSVHRFVVLTIGIVLLAGVLSGGAAFFLMQRVSNSYDDAVKAELQEKALAYGDTARAFLAAAGPDAPALMQAVVSDSRASAAADSPANAEAGFSNAFLNLEVWLPDASSANGFQLVADELVTDGRQGTPDEELVTSLLSTATESGMAAAALDEDAQLILTAVPIVLDDGTTVVALGTLSAEDEFAFFGSQRGDALRDSIGLSLGIILIVATFGGLLSLIVSRQLSRSSKELRESQQQLELVVETSPDLIALQGPNGAYQFVNSAYQKLLGYEASDLIGRSPVDLIHPDDLDDLAARYREITQSGQAGEASFRFRHADGHWVPIEANGQALTDAAGRPVGAVIVSRDITLRRRVELAMQESDAILKATLESTADGILVVDNAWRLLYANELFIESWSLPDDLVETEDVRRILPFTAEQVNDPGTMTAQAQRMLPSSETSLDTLTLKDGRIFEQYTVPLMIAGDVAGRVVSIRDITERTRAEEALREQARRDPLTGTLNHAAIIEELRSAISAVDDDATCAIAMVDVDGLKATNDTYGHQVGDALLISVGHAMSRPGAIIGRYGGDEFLAIIPSAGREEAERYRDQVVAALAEAHVTEAETGATVSVAASIGLAIYPEDGRTAHEILDLSDSAMYASRRQRPVGPGELSPSRTLGGERAAAMVGQIVPLLTASGPIEDKLRLVAHRLSVGAGYDAVNVDVFIQASGLPTARNTFSHVPDEVVDAWQSERRRMEDEPILRHIKSTGRALIVEDPQNEERLTESQRAVLRAAELQSALVVPLLWEDDMIGVLSVAAKRKNAFSAGDIEFLTAIATQITSVVRMTTLFDELQTTSGHLAQAREEAVLLLAAAAEAHDTTTGQHLRGVRGLTEALAHDLSYDEEDTRELGMAAVLHDIGKIRVPDHVLSTPGKLSDEQWQILIQHTGWGAEFLEHHAGFELAATVARSHHERWDGTGYPDGLSGDDIPESAAIVAVADAFDAITSDRPYGECRTIDEAVKEIEAFSNKQFNPRVVAALSRLHQNGVLRAENGPTATEQAA